MVNIERVFSVSGQEDFFWKSNPDWYRYDFEKNCILMTDKAPIEAIKSFEAWKEKYRLKTE